jgi:dynein heavy chain 2
LKNLHLVTSWLPLLEKELKVGSPHANFRLFLTTEPHPKFPAILLQSSLKVSYESPPGVKKNLLRTYASWQGSFVDQGSPQRAQALFALAWFHAVLQERRTYIPQGWSKFYEFSYSDLKAGATLMETLVTGGTSQWVTLRGLLENAVYGGRVDNEFDIKVLRTYLGQLFSAETFTRREIWSGVSIPANGRYSDYLALIKSLPETDSPSLFGLPENIDRSVQRFNSARVIKQLKQLSAVSEEHLKFDRAEWSSKIGPLVGLWQTLHRPGDTSSKAMEREDPLEDFLCAEAAMAGKLIEFVHKSLENISKVLSGSGLLTSTIEEDAVALLLGNVPDRWSDQWDGPSSPVAWLRALVRKAQSLKRLLERMATGQLFAEGISLGDLFHPETFLNAFRQLTARRLKTPMETLKLVTSFDSRVPGSIQLRDLMLQGSEIGAGSLTNASADSPDLTPLPPLFVNWSQGNGEEAGVVIPVYMSLEREKLLCTVRLPSQGSVHEKILSGAAIFLSASE